MVLESKIRIPRLSAHTVPRHRLLHGIEAADAAGQAVTAVSAPAGAGKTVLLAQCARQALAQGRSAAWLSLDAADDDPVILWAGLLAACRRAVRATDADAAARISELESQTDRVGPGFLADFLDTLGSLTTPLWIMVDDVHLIRPGPALEVPALLLRNRPAPVRLVLSGRSDPPLPIPRLILAGEATELRAADLAFDHKEAGQLLRRHGIHLPEEDLRLLLDRTEGWAAGLRLAALSLASEHDPAGYIARLAGDERPLADYLVAEVLATLSPDTVDLLIAVSVVDTVGPDLAARLSARPDAGATLDRLARENALVYHVDHAPPSYRLHGLLRSFLVAEGNRRDTEIHRRHHARAARWFAAQRLTTQAISHAVDAGDWPFVAELARRDGVSMLLRGDGQSLATALRLLPAGCGADPGTQLVGALAAVENHDLGRARQHLEDAGRHDAMRTDPHLRHLHAAALMAEARFRGDRTSRAAALVTAGRTPSGRPDVELLTTAQRGALRLWLGTYADAVTDLTAAVHQARRTEYAAATLECRSYLALAHSALGDFRAAEDQATLALAVAARRNWSSSPRMVPAYLVAAYAAWQRLENDTVSRYVSLAVTLDGDVEPELGLAARLLDASRACDVTANRRQALRLLHHQWPLGEPALLPTHGSAVCLTELQTALSLGDRYDAAQALTRAEHLLGDCGDVLVMRALLHASQGRRAALETDLAPIRAGTACFHSADAELAGWLLLADVTAESDEPSRSHEALVRALAIAAPRRHLRGMLAASPRVMSMLVHDAGRFGEHDDFVHTVLAARPKQAGPWPSSMYGESLTARELDLLRDLPSLLSLDEIAEAHVVSVNTVKTHLKAIYRKFDVSNRRQAVGRARELGLLGAPQRVDRR
ncbi:LuxR C-terminal-related transcriptional regulator [Jiangella rhizosphaerae]|uniref:HTH luxR-type domain-containing protein n=1 Tax=Jiangella rhizosphaerae TaxID=2293569 RepID=A0A418KKZ4_9ACTN|nr:LuxR C-terminal-related transcriptional regulator [Jiangella rhizosphaerae]RIQ18214.1 hypothetical protein DY240_21545 [Jiangella rhizosphaerae]